MKFELISSEFVSVKWLVMLISKCCCVLSVIGFYFVCENTVLGLGLNLPNFVGFALFYFDHCHNVQKLEIQSV